MRGALAFLMGMGLFSYTLRSSDDTVMEEITQGLNHIQSTLHQNPKNKQVAEQQLEALNKLRDTYSASDEFNEEEVLNWYTTLEQQASDIMNPTVHSKTLKQLRRDEKLGTLEIEYRGQGGQVRFLFVKAGTLKYIVSTPPSDVTKIAASSGLKGISLDGLNGKKVVFKMDRKGGKMTDQKVSYSLVRIVSFFKN